MEESKTYPAYRWLILLAGCMAIGSYAIHLVALVPVFGEIAKDLNVGMNACLNLSMVFVIVVGLSVAFGGIFVDRLGLTTVYVGSLLCASVPAVLMPWIGHSYGVVFVARLIQGPVAISFCTVGPILALWFPPRERGLAGGLLMCMMSLGPAVVLVAGPAILEAVGTWQRTIAIFSIPGWVSMALALFFTRRKPPQVAMAEGPAAPEAGGETYKQVLRLPITWIGTLVFFCNAWGFYTLYNVVPPYLALPAPMGLGLAPMMAGKLSLLLGAIGIPAFILGGIFFDKVAKGRSRPAIWMGYVISGVGAYLILLPFIHENMILLAIAIMAAGFGMTFMGSSITAFIAMNYPPYLAGSMVGFWFGIGTLGGALGIYLAGLATAITGSFIWGFNLIALAAALGVVITFALKPRAR